MAWGSVCQPLHSPEPAEQKCVVCMCACVCECFLCSHLEQAAGSMLSTGVESVPRRCAVSSPQPLAAPVHCIALGFPLPGAGWLVHTCLVLTRLSPALLRSNKSPILAGNTRRQLTARSRAGGFLFEGLLPSPPLGFHLPSELQCAPTGQGEGCFGCPSSAVPCSS